MSTLTSRWSAAILAILFPVQVLAVGDANLLVKQKPASSGQGYVLFSVAYPAARFTEEPPCVHVEMIPTAKGSKKPKVQLLSTTTGWHCNSAWKDKKAVVRADGTVRVLILKAVPIGEYEVREALVQFTSGQYVYSGEVQVSGIKTVQVNSDRLTYAGSFRIPNVVNATSIKAESNWEEDSVLLQELRPDLEPMEKTMGVWQ